MLIVHLNWNNGILCKLCGMIMLNKALGGRKLRQFFFLGALVVGLFILLRVLLSYPRTYSAHSKLKPLWAYQRYATSYPDDYWNGERTCTNTKMREISPTYNMRDDGSFRILVFTGLFTPSAFTNVVL